MSAALLSPAADAAPPRSAGEESCKLLDKFAVGVQLVLAAVALASLLIKRQREIPKRPFEIWFFDASKQACGASGVHLLNVLFSYTNYARHRRHESNPCVLYFLNLLLDTTIGVGILYGYLRVVDAAVRRLRLSEMQSGNYGDPPKISAWIKQSLAFLCALAAMKLTVLLLLLAFPMLEAFGRWVLSPLTSIEDPRYQVVFVLLLFPLIMNIIQFWIVDGVIKQKSRGLPCRPRDSEAGCAGGGLLGEVDAEEAGAACTDGPEGYKRYRDDPGPNTADGTDGDKAADDQSYLSNFRFWR